MPHRHRFIAFVLLPIVIAIAILAAGSGFSAQGESAQGPQVAMAAASTAYDPPPAVDPWLALRDTMAARTWYQAVAENNAKIAAQHVKSTKHSSSGHSAGGASACTEAARHADTATCIGACENGGDYGRSSNPTHFGKYQYDRQTWISHGGDPATWGSASPEEQERVFAEGSAKYGYGAWTPYDPC